MNLAMDVLRWLTVRAIRGRTWAGDRVYDSPASPADIRATDDRSPFIAVFVDDGDVTLMGGQDGTPDDPGLMTGLPVLTLVVESGISSPQKFDASGAPLNDDDPQPASIVSQINATDAGLEAQIGFLSRQAQQALLSTQPNNPWAELWQLMCAGGVQSVSIRRGGPSIDTGKPQPRFASRVMTIKVKTLAEPARGDNLAEFPFWSRFLAAASADPEMGGVAELVRAHIAKPGSPLPEWRLAQKYLTVPEETIRAIGLGPIDGTDPPSPLLETAIPLAEVEIVDPDPPVEFDPWAGLRLP